MSEPANLDWPFFRTPHFPVPHWTHCHWFFPNLLSGSVLFSIFWTNPTVPEKRHPELLTCFWQYWCSLTCLFVSFDSSLKNGRNRIWIAVQVEVFLLPAMALNQATDGDEVPVAAALLAHARQQRWKRGRALGEIVKWIRKQMCHSCKGSNNESSEYRTGRMAAICHLG